MCLALLGSGEITMNKLGRVSASRKLKIWWKLRKSKQKITIFVLQYLFLSLSHSLPPTFPLLFHK